MITDGDDSLLQKKKKKTKKQKSHFKSVLLDLDKVKRAHEPRGPFSWSSLRLLQEEATRSIANLKKLSISIWLDFHNNVNSPVHIYTPDDDFNFTAND